MSQESSFVKEEVPITCVTEAGFSGGPVMCTGGVLGAITCGYGQISLAVSTETISRMLKAWLKIKQDVSLKFGSQFFFTCFFLFMFVLVHFLGRRNYCGYA